MPPSRSLVEFLEAVVYGKRKDPVARLSKVGLTALSYVYGVLIRLYMLPFEIGLRRQRRIGCPVISVGNITVGGTGKSPTVQFLCRGLAERGRYPAALSYGYGGQLHGQFGVVSDGSSAKLGAEVAGDEPAMLASALRGIPVLVGKHRHISGRAAIRDLGADILVMDDGFQVWKLHRDLDIVLINADNPFDNGRTLPAGKLREPLSALRRADCVIATGDWDTGTRNSMLGRVRKYTNSTVYFGRFAPSVLISLVDGSEMPVDVIQGQRVFALSSIANPSRFEKTLADAGAVIRGRERFPDHHPYLVDDVAQVNESARSSGSELIITTDKDSVKLQGHEWSLPTFALRIELELDDEAGFWKLLDSRIGTDNA